MAVASSDDDANTAKFLSAKTHSLALSPRPIRSPPFHPLSRRIVFFSVSPRVQYKQEPTNFNDLVPLNNMFNDSSVLGQNNHLCLNIYIYFKFDTRFRRFCLTCSLLNSDLYKKSCLRLACPDC